MSRKIVHVVGTGTIGEPLIGLLCDFKDELGIDEVTFHKNTPLTTDRSKVTSLLNRGARLSTHSEKFDGFINIGLKFSNSWRQNCLQTGEHFSLSFQCSSLKCVVNASCFRISSSVWVFREFQSAGRASIYLSPVFPCPSVLAVS